MKILVVMDDFSENPSLVTQHLTVRSKHELSMRHEHAPGHCGYGSSPRWNQLNLFDHLGGSGIRRSAVVGVAWSRPGSDTKEKYWHQKRRVLLHSLHDYEWTKQARSATSPVITASLKLNREGKVYVPQRGNTQQMSECSSNESRKPHQMVTHSAISRKKRVC